MIWKKWKWLEVLLICLVAVTAKIRSGTVLPTADESCWMFPAAVTPWNAKNMCWSARWIYIDNILLNLYIHVFVIPVPMDPGGLSGEADGPRPVWSPPTGYKVGQAIGSGDFTAWCMLMPSKSSNFCVFFMGFPCQWESPARAKACSSLKKQAANGWCWYCSCSTKTGCNEATANSSHLTQHSGKQLVDFFWRQNSIIVVRKPDWFYSNK